MKQIEIEVKAKINSIQKNKKKINFTWCKVYKKTVSY